MQLFLSRKIRGEAGEDLVEKQNAEVGLMPVAENESHIYGYTDENRHVAKAFLKGEKPMLTIHDGVEVTRLLMACYQSAEQSKTVPFPPAGLDDFVPAVAKETWNPRSILEA
jgi:predicted dehydrogenase